jgi:hypothetical protein
MPFWDSYSGKTFGQNGLTKGFPWAEMVIVVVATAASVSKANIELIRQRGYSPGIAFARTWRFENGQALKDLVTPLPKRPDRRCWVPLEERSRRTHGTYTKRPACGISGVSPSSCARNGAMMGRNK